MKAMVRKYCFGYLRIRIHGYSPERFLNLCCNQNIELWNLQVDGSDYEMNIFIKDFFRLKPIIRKTKTKVQVIERTGFPFFVLKNKGRTMFMTGMLLCICFLLVMSTFIWKIEIDGNYRRSEEEIKSFLRTNHISEGTKKKKIHCDKLTEMIRENYEDIIWVSTSVDGMVLKIQVKENEDKLEIKKERTEVPMDIVADKAGIITEIITSCGVPKVKKGDSIEEGDLLVSGNIELQNDEKEIIGYQYCKSEANILARTEVDYRDKLEKTHIVLNETGKRRFRLWIENDKKRYVLGREKNPYKFYKKVTEERRFLFWKFGYEVIKECEQERKKYTDQETRALLSRNNEIFCRNLKKKGVQILENNVKIYCGVECTSARGTLILEEKIGNLIPAEPLTGINID